MIKIFKKQNMYFLNFHSYLLNILSDLPDLGALFFNKVVFPILTRLFHVVISMCVMSLQLRHQHHLP